MRSVLVVVVLLSLVLSASAGGARFPTFSSTSPLESKTLPTKFEELPEETLPTRQLDDIVNKQYIDQDIEQVTAQQHTPHHHRYTRPATAAHSQLRLNCAVDRVCVSTA